MSAAHQLNNQQGNNITLAQINEMLNNSGFPTIVPASIQLLQELEPRERIIRAIRSVGHDAGARKYLTDLFNKAGISLDSQGVAAPQYPRAVPDPQYPQGGQSHQSQANQGAQNDYPNTPPPEYTQHHQAGSQGNSPQSGNGDSNEGARLSPEDRMSVHVYGAKAALCFEADITKAGVPTVALDAANTTSPRQFDWGRKVRLQMTKQELPVVAAVLLGVIQSCEFKNHGPDNSKGFSIERQGGGKVYIKVFAKGEGVRGVPVMAPDAFYVATLIMRQLQKANPWLDSTALLALIRATQNN